MLKLQVTNSQPNVEVSETSGLCYKGSAGYQLCNYLRQGGEVMLDVCLYVSLSVCMLATLRKTAERICGHGRSD